MSLVVMETNATACAPKHVSTAEQEFAAFELLPERIRRLLMEANYCMSAWDVLVHWHTLAREGGELWATRQVRDIIADSEATEMQDFAAEQGYSAHLAAAASILRHGGL